MWKIVIAFGIGAAGGWFGRSFVEPDAYETSTPHASHESVPFARDRRASRARIVANDPSADADGARPPNDEAPTPVGDGSLRDRTDAELTAILDGGNRIERQRALGLAVARGLTSVPILLDRAITDPDADKRGRALDSAVCLAANGDGDMDVVAGAVVLAVRGTDTAARRSAVSCLHDLGARGADVARELIDEGGLDGYEWADAASCLVAAGRIDRLAVGEIDDGGRAMFQLYVSQALDRDPGLAPAVARLLREVGPPTEQTGVIDSYFDLALKARAVDVIRETARSSSAAPVAREWAVKRLLDISTESAAAVTIARVALGSASTYGRRRLLETYGAELARQGEAGRAVLSQIADHDPSRALRDRAAEILHDAEPR
jgi:hypothetical protein